MRYIVGRGNQFRKSLQELLERVAKLIGQAADRAKPGAKTAGSAVEGYLVKGLAKGLQFVDRLRTKK